MKSTNLKTDYLIIGSGVAGLHAALHARKFGEVILITKSGLDISSSYWAQGGVAAVLSNKDSIRSHMQDTLEAGRDLCNKEAVDILVNQGADIVRELLASGMPFDRKNGDLELGLEGGHSHRRVLHANGAATGKVLVEFLADKVVSESDIQVIEDAFVYELLTGENRCLGAGAYLYKDKNLLSINSRVTMLATGGYSGLYQRSTNPHTSTGDGLWLGYNAGVELQDLELVQFHPTAFFSEDGSTFLISEAVRGEGAHLYNEDGIRFLEKHPQQELAPRDEVSKAIFEQIQQQNSNFVYLDLRHLNTVQLKNNFPGLLRRIEDRGIDIRTERIPVAPAAHYCIGGVATDLDGNTSLKGLYACGEVAATGVHGANRLASNSLLECLVFSKRAVDHAAVHLPETNLEIIKPVFFTIDSGKEALFAEVQNHIAKLLGLYVGIQRDKIGLKKALTHLKELRKNSPGNSKEYFTLRTRGMICISELIVRSALQREESRGVHLRSDFPEIGMETAHTSFRKRKSAACDAV